MVIKSKKLYIILISTIGAAAVLLLLLIQTANIYPGAAQYEESGDIVTVERGAWNTEVFQVDRTNLDESGNLLISFGLTQIDQMERAAGSSLLLLFISAGASLYVSRIQLSTRARKIVLAVTYLASVFIVCYVIVSYIEMVNVMMQSLDQMQGLA